MANKTSQPTIRLEILRYDPEKDSAPRFQSYEVPFQEEWVVLDAINHIKDQIDGTLTHRWSCRMGVCGSCGMMVNGVAKLGCSAFLRDYYPNPIRVEPLAHFPIIRDLVVQLDDFMAKLQSVQPWIIRKEEKPVEQGEYLQSPAQHARYKDFSMCINCLLCYAACPVTELEPHFLGPAAIALAQRYNLDSRDEGRAIRQETVSSHIGIWQCTLVGECSVVCPKHVDPAGAIQQAKLASTMDWYKELLWPWGGKK